MKFYLLLSSFVLTLAFCKCQNPVNWTSQQLMQPETLADKIKKNNAIPVIISVGPDAPIPGSIINGMTNDKTGIDKFKKTLQRYPKKQEIVVYCGCCPFDKCPNVRPAIKALKEMKFYNYYLLNIPNNIRKDWIDKGFPNNGK